MKSVLAVIKDFKTDSVLLTKAIRFSPERLCVMLVRPEGGDNDHQLSDQVTQYVDKQYKASQNIPEQGQTPASVEVIFSDEVDELGLADLLVRVADTYSSDLIMLMKPEISENLEGLSLVKHLLRNASKVKICLCRQRKWSEPLQVMCAIDIESDNDAQKALDEKVLKYANEVLKQQLKVDLHLSSVIAHSRISEELDLIEPIRVLEKKGKEIKEKLLAFEQKNAVADSIIHIAAGLPYKEIPSLAKKKKIDMVVLGNVGRKGLKGLVIGNTAEKIIKNLSSDIIVINAL
jgi:nucleotide-binding universal stress UspA family protein